MSSIYPTFESLYSGTGATPNAAQSQSAGPGGMSQDPSLSATPEQDMGANPWGQQMDLWSQVQPFQAPPQQQKTGKK